MSRILPKQEAIPRTEMIALLRAELTKLTDEDNSICKVASERGIFCQGFHRSSDGGLRRCYSWLDKRRPGMSREELEDLANRWQLARQIVDDLPLACDVQQKEHDSCGGWDDFSNEQLSGFFTELTGRSLIVA
ncbi:MAG TPA: hypothetical protein VGQ65_04180 [Thermoanaerobaculia bacterium]|nr:hypothetical protein [Thermoanaerobaculia bacterium]